MVIRQYDLVISSLRFNDRRRTPVVVLSSHYLLLLDTLIVAPFVIGGEPTVDQTLNPVVSFDGQDHTVVVSLLRSVETRRLGQVIGSLVSHADALDRAVSRLFTSF